MNHSGSAVSAPSATQLHGQFVRRERTAIAIAKAAIEHAQSHDTGVHSFLEFLPESALAAAAVLDSKLAAGQPLGPLAGVPIALKDNIVTAFGKTTSGSKYFASYHSPYTATVAHKLIDAGAIIIGKTNLDEFGMGSSTEHSAFGPTRNPWDLSRVPGGSSGGSAAAVAAGFVPIALGSDTGGSIRQPASHCGVVGLKPTYGRVSRYGLVAYASSLDQIGPIAGSVHDAALCMSAISGFDDRDSTSAKLAPEDFSAELDSPLQRFTIAVPKEARGPGVSPAVSVVLDQTIESLRLLGATIIDCELPHMQHAIAAYYLIATAEASSNLARFDGVRYGHRADLSPGDSLMDLYCRSRSEGFGKEVRQRIMLGTHVLSSGYYDAYYLSALKVRRLIKNDHDAVFRSANASGGLAGLGADAILMPAAPGPAFKLGEKSSDPLALYLEDVFTVGVNLAGLPALTVPCGFSTVLENGVETRLPIGMQLIGPGFSERVLLRIGRMLERIQTADFRPPAEHLAS